MVGETNKLSPERDKTREVKIMTVEVSIVSRIHSEEIEDSGVSRIYNPVYLPYSWISSHSYKKLDPRDHACMTKMDCRISYVPDDAVVAKSCGQSVSGTLSTLG